MTKKQKLIEELKLLQVVGDTEGQHGEADRLLLDYINDKEIAKEYDKIKKWYA